jgi:hypothetical protein
VRTAFQAASDLIELISIPQRRLYNGATIRAIGLRTFGSNHLPASWVAEAGKGAAPAGCRQFDSASVCGHEACFGLSLAEIIATGLRREEIWVTSKLWNDTHAEVDVIASSRTIARRSPTGLSGSLSHLLAISDFSSAGMRRNLKQLGCEALHPRQLHANVAKDGRAGRSRPRTPHRHFKNHHSQASLVLRGARIRGSKCNQLLHEEFIARLDQSAQAFRVLIIKADMTIPYASVFFEIDWGYWDAEGRVRRSIAGSRSRVD